MIPGPARREDPRARRGDWGKNLGATPLSKKKRESKQSKRWLRVAGGAQECRSPQPDTRVGPSPRLARGRAKRWKLDRFVKSHPYTGALLIFSVFVSILIM